MLIEHSLDWARSNQIHKVAAEVPNDNVPAIALLRRAGFGEEAYLVNQFRRKSGGATDAVLLARETTA
jgi:ribosomal protein S18 acetylase RimI-like enzyme